MKSEDKHRMCILLVDDIPANLKILKQILITENYEVRIAISGHMALNSAMEDPPDLVLLDIMMPGMDGFEVCKRFKSHARTRDIPIIFLSALCETDHKISGFDVGGVDYITKPFQTPEVLARVKIHLKLRKLRKELEEKNTRLQEALDNVRILKGMLPICSACKKIRDDKGYWEHIEKYISEHSEALFTHSICPECVEALYGNQDWYIEEMQKKKKEDR